MVKRQVTEWTEREFITNRYNIWFGSDMPKTISAKELIDNGIDQVADKVADKVFITVGPNSVSVMDSGKGISTRKSPSGKTHLFLAVNKLYTSSNYDGTDGLAGTNGVGATATNALSETFKAGYIKDGGFVGYLFKDGVHKNEGETLDKLNDLSGFSHGDINKGFYVEANYNNSILEDEIDIDWIIEYTKSRVGELPDGSVVKLVDLKSENDHIFSKEKNSDHYVNSWEESVNDVPSSSIITLRGGWKFAFCDTKDNFNNIKSIVQGAPVQNPSSTNIHFEIEDTFVPIRVPVTFFYRGKKNPAYRDQTKRRVTMTRVSYMNALKAAKDLYKKYFEEAENKYLADKLGDSKSSMYYPASSSSDYKELIVAEGFSAATNIKSGRKHKTQACFALRGKLLNVMQKDLRSAMKSDVIRDFMNVIINNKFDKIIITPDADPDGAHICTLLLGVLAKYGKKYLSEGKVYYCKTPLYVFEKGRDIKWSDDVNDRPEGYKLSVKKGLGSLTAQEVILFITNPETRKLFKFSYDEEEDLRALEFALVEGGKGWIDS